MMNELRRMATFATYPDTSPMSSRKLFSAGFEFTGRDHQVTCSECHLTIDGWKETDIPLNEHHRRSPACCRLAQLPPPCQLSNCSFPNSPSNCASENVGLISVSQRSSCFEVEKINKSETTNVHSHMKSEFDRSNPDFELLKQEKFRLETYFDWPQSSKLNPSELATEGFFYIGERDKVQCVFCRGVLFNWLEGDHPQSEHRKHFPNCHFVRGRNVGNVKLELCSLSPSASRLSKPATVQVQIKLGRGVYHSIVYKQNVDGLIRANPAAEAKNESASQTTSSNESIIGQALDSIAARAVLSMGYSKQVVQQAINNQLTKQGKNFESAEQLLESIMSLGVESHDPMLPVTPSIPELSAAPDIISSSDEDLSLEHTSRINQEHNEPVEITAGNYHDQSTLRLNEEQLENLQRTTGLSSAAESSMSGAVKQKNKKRNKKNKRVIGNQNVNEHHVENETGRENETAKRNQQTPKSRASGMSETNVASNAEDLQLMEENKNLREAKTCKVCMDKEVNTVFLPCGHLVCCNECAANIHKCAICRTLIRGTVKIFLS